MQNDDLVEVTVRLRVPRHRALALLAERPDVQAEVELGDSPSPTVTSCGWAPDMIEQAVRGSIRPFTSALDLMAAQPGRWAVEDDVRAATGLVTSPFQLSGMWGAAKTRFQRDFGRDDSFVEARKEQGRWSYRLAPDVAEIVRRVREDME